MHILCKFREIPSKTSWLIFRTSPKCPNFECFKAKWPWRWRSRSPIINRLLKVIKIHHVCKFGELPSIRFRVIVRKCSGYGRTDGRTDGQTQATTIPLQPERPRGKNDLIPINIFWVIARTKVLRTDGQTDGRRRRQYPFSPKGRGVKNPKWLP